MRVIDWRKLYDQNRAAIAKSGIRVPEMPVAPLTDASVPAIDHRQLLSGLPGQGLLTHAPADVQDRKPHRQLRDARLARRADPRGAGRALVHVPRGVDPSVPAAIVCMLHGCTQDPAAFAAATAMNATADRHGFVVVYPGQARSRNAQGCWNWFLPDHQQRGAGEPHLIAGIVGELLAREPAPKLDPARIFVAGLSSGGAMALTLAACYPDLFAAVAVHSGLPYRSAHDVGSAFAVMGGATANRPADGHAMHAAMGRHARAVPSLVLHGTADRTVAPGNARQILSQAMAANHLADPHTPAHDPRHPSHSERLHAPGGMSYTRSRWIDARGALMHESIEVDGLGHAWSGGVAGGSYTDPRGPSATEAIWAFFSQAGRAAG
jgi:poly(hydroxyalkanoate) depolymerase family esterase